MKIKSEHRLRILHVVGGMNRGGVETWLMHILRNIDRDYFQMDFLVHTNHFCAYDDEIRNLGSEIIPCLDPSKPWIYAANFKQIILDFGPYDIIHSHVHHFSGYVLRLAKQCGIPVRIAHSHNDTSAVKVRDGLYRQLYNALTKRWIECYATSGIGCSYPAAIDLFGIARESDQRWKVLYYGIDLNPFINYVDPVTVRSEFGMPADAFVVGHVGRFDEQKNHGFILEIAFEVAKREPNMYLLLIGQGSLQPDIKHKALQMGLGDRVIFAGSRPDVAYLMLGVMDAFLLPSLYEGLPLVLLEAQAAGLPCIFSDTIPEEINVVKPLIHRLSLSQPASKWAEVVLSQRNIELISQPDALKILKNSPFCIEKSMQNLQNIYGAKSSIEVSA